MPQRPHPLAHADLALRHSANQKPAKERVAVDEGHLEAMQTKVGQSRERGK